MTTSTTDAGDSGDGDIFPRLSLALHIRRLRQWHGERPITQSELAQRSGISTRQLSRYETARALPAAFGDLTRLATALGVPMAAIIAPQLLAGLQAVVAARRGDACRASSA